MEHHPFGNLRVRFDGEEGAGPGVNRGLFGGFANALKGGEKVTRSLFIILLKVSTVFDNLEQTIDDTAKGGLS